MADPVGYNPLTIAGISAGSAIVGGLITAGSNLLIERQRSKRDAEKVKLEKEAQRIELRNQAYIKFLSLALGQVYRDDSLGKRFVNREYIEESVALVLTHGSPSVVDLLLAHYPFQEWEEIEKVKTSITLELIKERDREQEAKEAELRAQNPEAVDEWLK